MRLSPYSPSTPSQPSPLSPFDPTAFGFVHVSFIHVPENPSPFSLHYPLPPPLWSLSVCSLFPCPWFYFACLFVLLIRFHLYVRSHGICLSLAWFTSLSIMLSRLIQAVARSRFLLSFCCVVFHCVNVRGFHSGSPLFSISSILIAISPLSSCLVDFWFYFFFFIKLPSHLSILLIIKNRILIY